MDILNQFSTFDVFVVGLGLILASIIRIFYDSYKDKKQLQTYDDMLHVYNESMDIYEEGVLILSHNNHVLFANREASRILGNKDISFEYLKKHVRIKEGKNEIGFLEKIYAQKSILKAYIITESNSIPVSINTNTFITKSLQKDTWKIVVIQDITAKIHSDEKTENIESYYDLLTNLPTRYHLGNDLVPVILKASQGDSIVALGMFSLKEHDILKAARGIEKMDLVLKKISTYVQSILENHEKLYRFDCSSFSILFTGMSNKEIKLQRLKKIIQDIEAILLEESIGATLLQGFYPINQKNITVNKILDESYKLMRATQIEKTDATVYGRRSSDTNSRLANRLTKEDFTYALEHKDFFFFYQPIYNLEQNTLAGLEVLTRLNHKQYGFLTAGDFLHKAIEYDMMPEITAHLLDNVLGQQKFWSNELGIEMDMTINLALADLQTGLFAELLEKKLYEYEIDPKVITIDIPESVLAEDFEAVAEEFYVLNKIGVKLAIDHFGKAFINLKYIDKLPLHKVKIDASIVRNISKSDHKRRVISSLISMANELGLHVGANYVDTKEVRDELVSLGCDSAQGHYFGKALPVFEVTDLVKQSKS